MELSWGTVSDLNLRRGSEDVAIPEKQNGE